MKFKYLAQNSQKFQVLIDNDTHSEILSSFFQMLMVLRFK